MSTTDNGNEKAEQSKTVAPHYDERTQRTMLRFLAAWYTHYQDKKAGIKRFAGSDCGHPLFSGQIRYCDNALGVISYLAWRVRQRQNHLLSVTDADIEKAEKEWLLHSSSYDAAEQSPQSVSSTTDGKAVETPGAASPNGSGTNGRGSGRKPLMRLSKGRKRGANSQRG